MDTAPMRAFFFRDEILERGLTEDRWKLAFPSLSLSLSLLDPIDPINTNVQHDRLL